MPASASPLAVFPLSPFSLLLVLVSWLATGCVIRGDAQAVAYGVDVAAIAAGASLMVGEDCAPAEDDLLGLNKATCDFEHGLGKVLLVGGGIGLVANIIINRDTSEKPMPQPQPRIAAQQQGPPGMSMKPGLAECSEDVAAWRNEDDHKARYDLLRKLPLVCQREIIGQD